jgi:methylmalonyl-CoA epimerase
MLDLPSSPRGLAHVALAVPDAEAVARQYARLLGARVRSRETLGDRGIRVIFLEVGGVPLELIEPIEAGDDSNAIVKFLKQRGPGLHHLAFQVADAAAALASARSVGAELIDAAPRLGAERCLVGFLHPRSTAGVLLEFVQPPGEQE